MGGSVPAPGVVGVVTRGVGQGEIDVSMEFAVKLVLVEQTGYKLGGEGEQERLQRSEGGRMTHFPAKGGDSSEMSPSADSRSQ